MGKAAKDRVDQVLDKAAKAWLGSGPISHLVAENEIAGMLLWWRTYDESTVDLEDHCGPMMQSAPALMQAVARAKVSCTLP
jgi:hypothetical protein